LIRNRKNRCGLTEAAETPGCAATSNGATDAATATASTAATATSATATAAATAAAPATPRHLLQGAAIVFLVEEMECREADVGDLFLAERDALCRCEVELLRKVKPAAPNAGTAALVTRFRFEVCFTRGIVASSIPVQDELFFDSSLLDPTLRRCATQDFRVTNALLHIQFLFILMNDVDVIFAQSVDVIFAQSVDVIFAQRNACVAATI
jgi:hypothetical protein